MENAPLDPITEALQKQYFQMLKAENIGHTPDLTRKIDALEEEINKRLGLVPSQS